MVLKTEMTNGVLEQRRSANNGQSMLHATVAVYRDDCFGFNVSGTPWADGLFVGECRGPLLPRSLSNFGALEVPVTLMRRNVTAFSFAKKGSTGFSTHRFSASGFDVRDGP
jgi:hypothetical protein